MGDAWAKAASGLPSALSDKISREPRNRPQWTSPSNYAFQRAKVWLPKQAQLPPPFPRAGVWFRGLSDVVSAQAAAAATSLSPSAHVPPPLRQTRGLIAECILRSDDWEAAFATLFNSSHRLRCALVKTFIAILGYDEGLAFRKQSVQKALRAADAAAARLAPPASTRARRERCSPAPPPNVSPFMLELAETILSTSGHGLAPGLPEAALEIAAEQLVGSTGADNGGDGGSGSADNGGGGPAVSLNDASAVQTVTRLALLVASRHSHSEDVHQIIADLVSRVGNELAAARVEGRQFAWASGGANAAFEGERTLEEAWLDVAEAQATARAQGVNKKRVSKPDATLEAFAERLFEIAATGGRRASPAGAGASPSSAAASGTGVDVVNGAGPRVVLSSQAGRCDQQGFDRTRSTSTVPEEVNDSAEKTPLETAFECAAQSPTGAGAIEAAGPLSENCASSPTALKHRAQGWNRDHFVGAGAVMTDFPVGSCGDGASSGRADAAVPRRRSGELRFTPLNATTAPVIPPAQQDDFATRLNGDPADLLATLRRMYVCAYCDANSLPAFWARDEELQCRSLDVVVHAVFSNPEKLADPAKQFFRIYFKTHPEKAVPYITRILQKTLVAELRAVSNGAVATPRIQQILSFFKKPFESQESRLKPLKEGQAIADLLTMTSIVSWLAMAAVYPGRALEGCGILEATSAGVACLMHDVLQRRSGEADKSVPSSTNGNGQVVLWEEIGALFRLAATHLCYQENGTADERRSMMEPFLPVQANLIMHATAALLAQRGSLPFKSGCEREGAQAADPENSAALSREAFKETGGDALPVAVISDAAAAIRFEIPPSTVYYEAKRLLHNWSTRAKNDGPGLMPEGVHALVDHVAWQARVVPPDPLLRLLADGSTHGSVLSGARALATLFRSLAAGGVGAATALEREFPVDLRASGPLSRFSPRISNCDVVFVHGMRGAGLRTWRWLGPATTTFARKRRSFEEASSDRCGRYHREAREYVSTAARQLRQVAFLSTPLWIAHDSSERVLYLGATAPRSAARALQVDAVEPGTSATWHVHWPQLLLRGAARVLAVDYEAPVLRGRHAPWEAAASVSGVPHAEDGVPHANGARSGRSTFGEGRNGERSTEAAFSATALAADSSEYTLGLESTNRHPEEGDCVEEISNKEASKSVLSSLERLPRFENDMKFSAQSRLSPGDSPPAPHPPPPLLSTSHMSQEQLAAHLHARLQAAGVGARRPVVWVAHSLGGLAVKRMLLADPELAGRSRGVVFFGTPHFGSPLAAGYRLFRPLVAPYVRELDPERFSDRLRELNAAFERLCMRHSIIVCSFGETRETVLPSVRSIFMARRVAAVSAAARAASGQPDYATGPRTAGAVGGDTVAESTVEPSESSRRASSSAPPASATGAAAASGAAGFHRAAAFDRAAASAHAADSSSSSTVGGGGPGVDFRRAWAHPAPTRRMIVPRASADPGFGTFIELEGTDHVRVGAVADSADVRCELIRALVHNRAPPLGADDARASLFADGRALKRSVPLKTSETGAIIRAVGGTETSVEPASQGTELSPVEAAAL